MALFPIDVIIRTYNRSFMISDAVASVMAADRSGVDLRVLIVDNNSADDTPQVLARIAQQYGERIVLLTEKRPGGQIALNTAIAAASAPVLAFFDDDERVRADWLQTIRQEMSDPDTDFIAGPYKPIWNVPEPEWLPEGFGGVLGIIDNGPDRRKFGADFGGMLTQGNCAVRHTIFAQAGPYPSELKTAEDRWLFEWLMAHGKTGYYCPALEIGHLMQEDRLNRDYFRRWARREGRDTAVCDRLAQRPVTLKKGWYWRQRFGDAVSLIRKRAGTPEAFAAELNLRQMKSYIAATIFGAGN
jgi:glycosyltransferase involved in cell wall biosynthesis